MDEKTALSYAIAKAIAYQENGGKLGAPKAGKTGELKSIYQFTPGTWKVYAKEVLGDPNAPLTADNETQVVVHKVQKWIDKGYNAKQIASMWNAGEDDPDAWSGKFSNGNPSKGVNQKYGVPFDVPKYAEGVHKYATEFYKKDFSPEKQQPEQVYQSTPAMSSAVSQTPVPKKNGLLGGLIMPKLGDASQPQTQL